MLFGKKRFSFVLVAFFSMILGLLGGSVASTYLYQELFGEVFDFNLVQERIIERETKVEKEYIPQVSEEEIIIDTVEKVSPSVVSIIITKDLSLIEERSFKEFDFEFPEEEREIGAGTAFIVSEDGLALTNKHVVLDEEASYTILTNEGKKYEAEVLAKDPMQDLAIIKIKSDEKFKPVELGDSDELRIGQKAIAIGNALGEFKNTVSVGVVSGLERTVTARGAGIVQVLEGMIQTDAAINRGNSGGPLLNLEGEVIGINTAMAKAENIGFAIPVNRAKRAINQVKERGEIVYPFLGIKYTLIDEQIQKRNDLPVDYGAWIAGNGESAIVPDSAAEESGLKEWDIILEFDGKRITKENSLASIIINYEPDEEVELKILRDGSIITIEVVLGERTS